MIFTVNEILVFENRKSLYSVFVSILHKGVVYGYVIFSIITILTHGDHRCMTKDAYLLHFNIITQVK